MAHLVCEECGNILSNNKPIEMMGFIDFTILPDGKIKVNRSWSKPKNITDIGKKKVAKFEGAVKSGSVEM